MSMRMSCSKNSLTMRLTMGIIVDPPASTTLSIWSFVMPAFSSTLRTGSRILSRIGLQTFSNFSRVNPSISKSGLFTAKSASSDSESSFLTLQASYLNFAMTLVVIFGSSPSSSVYSLMNFLMKYFIIAWSKSYPPR